MLRYKIDQIFPTSVLKVDCSDQITTEDQIEMTKNIDDLIVEGKYCKSPYSPKYQTDIILFNRDTPYVWARLRQTFIDACGLYLQEVSDFTLNQDKMRVVDVHAWCYKGWKSLNEGQSNPWHNHNPAFLSGVFYLKIPDTINYGGTELGDPRFPECQGSRNFITSPQEFTWSIFPGWLTHRSIFQDTEEPRYVVAANAYCSPIHE